MLTMVLVEVISINYKVKLVDKELYLKKETKVFFDDQVVPEEFKDPIKYDLVIIKRHSAKENRKEISI